MAPAVSRFAVIGHPVAHSLSPVLHAANFRACAFAGLYTAIDVAPAELPEAVKRFVAEGYRGFNCTIPHKEAILSLVDACDASAVACGAANTVLIAPSGRTTAFNTDCTGFAQALVEACPSYDWHRPVVLLGAGGAARAVAVACLARGCTALTIANRTAAKAAALAEVLRGTYSAPIVACSLAEVPPCPEGLVINTTSVGLRPADGPVVPAAYFGPGQVVCDIIPLARETATCAAARAAGARTVGGLGMLVHQGAEAFRIWTGQAPCIAAMAAALNLPPVRT